MYVLKCRYIEIGLDVDRDVATYTDIKNRYRYKYLDKNIDMIQLEISLEWEGFGAACIQQSYSGTPKVLAWSPRCNGVEFGF